MKMQVVLSLLALGPAIAGAQNWNVSEPRFTDGCRVIGYGPASSLPGVTTFSTLTDALGSIDSGTQISHIDLSWALRDDSTGLQSDIRSYFEEHYAQEYAALLESERTTEEWREPTLRARLQEAVLASTFVAEIQMVLSARMLKVEGIEFEKAQILRANFPDVSAFASAKLNSCQ